MVLSCAMWRAAGVVAAAKSMLTTPTEVMVPEPGPAPRADRKSVEKGKT
jgi:hypothetical protein